MPPLPPYVVGLPALDLSVIDSKSLGVPWVALNASVFSFNGLCSQGLPILTTSNATIMTDGLGRAQITGNLDVTGCSVRTRAENYGCVCVGDALCASCCLSRLPQVSTVCLLPRQSRSIRTLIVTVRRDLTRCCAICCELALGLTLPACDNRIHRSTEHGRLPGQPERTHESNHLHHAVSRTTSKCYLIGCVLDEQFRKYCACGAAAAALQVGMREPFSVIVQVVEHGLPVPGAQVVVTLIAPKHSNVRLSGEMRAISDSTGKATLSLHFPSGRSGLYSLLISCDSVIEHLLTPGGIGSEVAKQAAKAQRAVLGSDIVLSTFAARVEGLQSIANSTLHFAARARLEMQMQATAQLAADDSANCIGFVPLPWWGASPILVDNTIGIEATQACIDTKMQSRLDGLRSCTTPVDRLTMYKSEANVARNAPSGSDSYLDYGAERGDTSA